MITDTTASHCVTDWTWNGLHRRSLTQFWFAQLHAPSSLYALHSSSDMFFFFSSPPPPLLHILDSLSFTSRPPPPYLPLALPPSFPSSLQDGQGRSQNTIWNSETSHSTAGLLHNSTTEFTTQFTEVLQLLQTLFIPKWNCNFYRNYFYCYHSVIHRITTVHQKLHRSTNQPLKTQSDPQEPATSGWTRTRNQKPKPIQDQYSSQTPDPDQKRPVKISKGCWKSLMGLLTIGKCGGFTVLLELSWVRIYWFLQSMWNQSLYKRTKFK